MSMYTLKSIVRRGSALGGAVALLVAAVVPSASVFADALNPLTERSLLLSSSAPGFVNTDGSGNSESNLNANGENFAPPGSGPNGRKTGETFSFRMSTDTSASGINTPIKAFSLQYCTTAAGKCQAPGNNHLAVGSNPTGTANGDGDFRNGAYNASTNTDGRMTNTEAWPLGRSDLNVNYSSPVAGTDFVVWHDVNDDGVMDGGEDVSSGWAMATKNAETSDFAGVLTGTFNYITLYNTSSTLQPLSSDKIYVIFNADSDDYITNPGSGAFFVKINTYGDVDNTTTPGTPILDANDVIDGGVTVANVMTDSIHITTKVLETMSFSVGTQNRDNVIVDCDDAGAITTNGDPMECEGSSAVHGTCDAIQNINNNRLSLGNPNAEYSLETSRGWDVKSYWRLSSNSSGGATVYYSGNTLANTVGDEITQMPAEAVSTPGTEQFGLGFVDAGLEDTEDPAFVTLVGGVDDDYNIARSFPFKTLSTQTGGIYAALGSQPLSADYDEATGDLDDGNGHPHPTTPAKFKFLKSSLTVPEPIAQQNDQVVSCATAKMRYVGNIAADTPAGVYTTKINYLAAPQY